VTGAQHSSIVVVVTVTTQVFGKIEINGIYQNTKFWSQQKLLFLIQDSFLIF
jgi:hypothetical protein